MWNSNGTDGCAEVNQGLTKEQLGWDIVRTWNSKCKEMFSITKAQLNIGGIFDEYFIVLQGL